MSYLLVRHKVADYAKWKAVYDAHQPVRQSAKLKELHLLRGIDDANEVVMLFAVDDLAAAQGFVSSANLRETMEKAGVTDQPSVYFLH
jgi:hypothetical protein